MTDLQIRDANIDDAGLILHFIRELALFEKALHEVQASEEDLRRTLFGEGARAQALICESDSAGPIGFAVYFFNYSTWLGKYGLFLEDLYISRDQRRHGAGRAMLKHLAAIAVEQDCGRFEWNVLDWNQPARDFYESLGAQAQSEWLGYRLSGDALQQLARQ